jgi:phosphohistidine phosphatase
MTRTLTLARHAKSSWDDPELSDFERPLNRRGHRDAPFMGELLQRRDFRPELIVSSPANRALATARIIAEELEYPLDRIVVSEKLYEADSDDILEVIRRTDDACGSLMLFGHNPGLTLTARSLASIAVDTIPTCGIICLAFDSDSWKDLGTRHGRVEFFEYPKKYQ